MKDWWKENKKLIKLTKAYVELLEKKEYINHKK
jgi:hypothetical protein